uniref:Putative secreted protein n=1 Tax=Anopheles marajoara TaxID=58244 RepID=A0A2M4C9Q6_9DIPT
MPLLTMHLNNLILLLALASFSTSTARVGAMPHQARGHIIITQPQIATPYGSYSRVYARARSLLLNRVFFAFCRPVRAFHHFLFFTHLKNI